MGKDTVISVILRLRDEMGGQAKKALDGLAQAAKGAGASAKALDSLDRATRTTTQGAGQAAKAMDTLGRSAVQGAGQAARAVGRIGHNAAQAAGPVQAVGRAVNAFRSERVLAAARHAAQLAKEARAARRAVDDTAKAAGRLERAMTRAGGAGRTAASAMRGVGQVGAGLAAGRMAAGHALARPISYESRLNKMARVAFADRDAAGQVAGVKELNGVITEATKTGGGTRENASEALNALLAGNMEYGLAARSLPKILKASMGGDISALDLSKVVLSGTKQGWFSEDDIAEVLDVLVKGGQEGSFEGKDMAKWMPELMTQAAGMKGKEGFRRLVANLQGQSVVAGSNDKAANNLANLLGKLFAPDTQKDFVAIGIDLQGTLAKAAGQGKDPLTAIVKLMEEKVFAKDKRFQDIKKKLESAKDDNEKTVLLEHMADIVKRSALGTVFQDREAQLGLAASMSQKDYIGNVFTNLANAKGTVDTGFQTASQSTEFKLQQLQNEKDNAMFRTLENIGPSLNSVLESTTNLAREFPGLTTVVAEAATAIGVMTAAAAAFGALRLFTGGAAAVAGGGGLLKGAPGLLGRFAGPLAAFGLAGLDIYSVESNAALSRAQKNISHTENAGGLAAAIAGMKMGAMAGGTIGAGFAGVGAAPGALLGGLAGGALGWWAGSKAGRQVGHWMFGPSQETMDQAKKLVVEDRGVIKVESVLKVDGREMAKVVNDYNAADAKRH